MNIIIVAKPFSSPKVVRFDDRRAIAKAGGIVCALLLTLFGGGLVAGTVFGGPSLVKAQLTAARNDLSAQRAEVGRMQQDMHRNTDALALRIGELQAEAARLNALGERIAKLGKLDDGEFNFDRKPGVGGPSVAAIALATPAPDIKLAVNRLDDLLASQANQLDLLESMLLDRQLDSSLMPSGSPVRSGYVSSSYGSRIDPFTGGADFHQGMDFSGDSGDEILGSSAVTDQVGDRDERQAVSSGECSELRHPRHRPVIEHHLAQHARMRPSRQTGQIDSGFGVPGALQHATRAGPQRKHVTRPVEVAGRHRRIGERLDRHRPVGR